MFTSVTHSNSYTHAVNMKYDNVEQITNYSNNEQQ